MERKVISNWKKKPFAQVVYLEVIGKGKNGKVLYSSKTKHERV